MPSGRPPLQTRPSQHGSGHGRAGCALPRLGDPRVASSDTSGQGIDLNRNRTAGVSSLAGPKKQWRISAAASQPIRRNDRRAPAGDQDGHDLRGCRRGKGDYTEYDVTQYEDVHEGYSIDEQPLFGNDDYTQDMAGEITQATAATLAASLAATLADGKKITQSTVSYNVEEDTMLCSTWIEIFHDPLCGAKRKGNAYWNRVGNYLHEHRASNELWRIILEGYKPYNPDMLTRREEVDSQLNSIALHMIQTSVGTKYLALVRKFTTAKEAWEGLAISFMGSESMKRNKYSALRNQAEGFMRLPDEDHQEMYRRLITIADAFRNVGAQHIDDFWIKDKYIDCMIPFEPMDVKSLLGRESYPSLTSQQVVHEFQALKVAKQNSQDSRNRAIGMARGTNIALTVNTVEEVNSQEPYRTSWSMSYPEDLEYHYNDHKEFHAKTFWVDPSKAKEDNIKRNNSSGFKISGPRSRSCYNCGDKHHFIAECPYEHRETRGGRLIPKDKSKDSKAPNKKFYNKNKKNKRPSRIVLMTKEEYSSDDNESSSDEEETSKTEEPLDADDWLQTMENNLEVAGVEAAEKVLFATHYLSGPARAWWTSARTMNVGQIMRWEDFKLKFSKYHVPQGLIKKMRDEFRELKQGRMSVVEYRDRFLTLSRYAPDETDTNEKRKERFLNELHDEMQTVLVNIPFADLEALVDSAIQMEGNCIKPTRTASAG
ncbi:hypothetical protein QYE76_011634 [Lolium multiflorum]|uniref:CCHC-type domain-containing protein n=1 Tax=Lolium multiflorum TaxID=4521 RepID=A0AAD8X5H3_LOLMU|nr:hypothetical protein QYE76_011634 [Lolium multiflorum]